MNKTNIMVTLDAEHHTAEFRMMTPRDSHPREQFERAMRRLGFALFGTVELATPGHLVIRTRIAEIDGGSLSSTRVVQIVRAARASAAADEFWSRAA